MVGELGHKRWAGLGWFRGQGREAIDRLAGWRNGLELWGAIQSRVSKGARTEVDSLRWMFEELA